MAKNVIELNTSRLDHVGLWWAPDPMMECPLGDRQGEKWAQRHRGDRDMKTETR